MQQSEMNRYDRILSWVLPAVVGLTPLVVIYALVRPHVGQAFFFEAAALAITISLGVAWMAGWRGLPGRPTAPFCLLVLNALALAGSVAVSPEPVFSLKSALLPICSFLFLGSLLLFPDRRLLLSRITLVIVALAGLLSVYGILQHFKIDFLHYSAQVQKNKVIATIGHPNYLGSVLGPALFFVLGFVFSCRGRWKKVLGCILLVLILFCVTVARTRGVWLGIITGVLGVTLLGVRYSLRHRLRMRWVGVVLSGTLATLAGLWAVVYFVLPLLGAGIDIQERLTMDNEGKSRLYYWRAATDMAFEKPVFGQGYARFDPHFWEYTLELQKKPLARFYYDMIPAISGRSPDHAHNEYLEILAEQGFVGFVSFAAFLLFFLYFGYLAIMAQGETTRAMASIAIFGAFLATMVDAMFGFPWHLPVSLIVFMVVLAWLYEYIYPQDVPRAAEPTA